MNLGNWLVFVNEIDRTHIVPEADLRPHDLTPTCWCSPVLNEEAHYLHNSMDGREKLEGQSRRRLH